MRGLLLALALAVPGAAGAEEADYDPRFLAACLMNIEGQAERASCIGIGAEACLDSDRTDSVARVTGCYGAETDDWAARLAGRVDALREKRGEPDALAAEIVAHEAWAEGFCAVFATEIAAGEETFTAAQQDCMMQQTAKAALALEPLAPAVAE